MNRHKVAVVMGSDSDLPVMTETVNVLKEFGIEPEVRILSAHRSPDATAKFAKEAVSSGIKVIIAGAGGAAHLAGALASHTTLPVIGVPLAAQGLNGLDALLSTVQMPSGIPVATVAIGTAGAKNAAILALEIIATADEEIDKKLKKYRDDLSAKVSEKDKQLRQQIK
ncbi:MAG: 5-(carboxyamino)imidazole ribonucleotide mutase [Candidatus Omnitrophica bacterium]|nr:5-(carboxyamino)imidazole ribonucleotide mutase [Candidatus Omnitrophota bacterium]